MVLQILKQAKPEPQPNSAGPCEHTRARLAVWRAWLGACILLLTAASYWIFPGHLYLFEDTNIYLPMLERLWDSTLLKRDFLATRPHLAFTIYDEVALRLRELTGLGFREILTFEQWVFRAIGILGVYLIGRALKLSERMAWCVAALFTLGATIVGSAIASPEFEPLPRGFAFALILLAIGLVAYGRYLGAGIAASIAFLYHAPIGYPFWVVYLALAVWPSQSGLMKKRLLAFVPLFCAGLFLFFLSRPEVAISPPEPLFRRLDPLQAQLQILVAPYNWISTWPFAWEQHHLFLYAISALAFWRIRKSVPRDLCFFLVGLPLVSVLSMPTSFILLEKMHWSLIPQFQPMRALVYLAVVTGILCAAAGIKAVQYGRYWEGLVWLAVACAIPTEARVLHVLLPRLSSLAMPELRRRVIIVIALAFAFTLAIWSDARRKRWAGLMLSAAMLAPFFLLPYLGNVNRFPARDNPELEDLSIWARSSTPKDSMFLFPDAGLDPAPTVFRAGASRAVYIDWRSNGQVNYFSDFAREWWARWQRVMVRPFNPEHLDDYLSMGIDYLVVRPLHHIPGRKPVYRNSRFLVYRLD